MVELPDWARALSARWEQGLDKTIRLRKILVSWTEWEHNRCVAFAV